MGEQAILPLRPKLIEGESLTSWLVRIADANCCSIATLLDTLTGAKVNSAFKWEHLEIAATAEFLAAVCKAVGCEEKVAYLSTFIAKPECARPSGQAFAKTWMLGKRRRPFPRSRSWSGAHKDQDDGGKQYCPNCLDCSRPHLPLLWRMSFATVCPIHRRLLVSVCPHCNAGTDFTIRNCALRAEAGSSLFRKCWSCGKDLCQGVGVGHTRDSEEFSKLIRLQEIHMDLFRRASIHHKTSSRAYFSFLHWVLCDLFHPQGNEEIREAALRMASVTLESRRWCANIFRSRNVTNRATLLLMASALTECWPTKFLDLRELCPRFDAVAARHRNLSSLLLRLSTHDDPSNPHFQQRSLAEILVKRDCKLRSGRRKLKINASDEGVSTGP